MEQTWTDKVSTKALGLAEGLAKGFHAIPKPDANPLKALPSMHRLLNVLGMVGGFASVQYLSNIMFACKINGSKCEEIEKKDVPKPLQFLHGILAYNPFDDAPSAQWKKVLHQMLPAMGGAVGAIKGSEMFFTVLNGREKVYNDLMDITKHPTLSPLQADTAASFAQGKAWRVMAGALAWLSSASGLTVFYGVALNSAFKLCNGAKIFSIKSLNKLSNNHFDLGFGPEKGVVEVMKSFKTVLNDVVADPKHETEITEAFAKRLLNNMEPFGKLTKVQREDMVKRIQSEFSTFEKLAAKKDPKEFEAGLKATVNDMLSYTDIEGFRPGNNGPIGAVVKHFPGVQKKLDSILSRTEHSSTNPGRT